MYFITRHPLTVEDRHFLSPWAKWKYHGRFPFKFMFHVLIVILCIAQIMLPYQQFSVYSTAVQDTLVDRSINSVAGDNDNRHKEWFVTSLADLKTVIETFRDTYFDINEQSLSRFDHIVDSGGRVSPITVNMILHNETLLNTDITGAVGTMPITVEWHSKTDFYPFDLPHDDLVSLLDGAIGFTFDYSLEHDMIWQLSRRHVPYLWRVHMAIDMDTNGGRAGVQITPKGTVDNVSMWFGLTRFPVRVLLDLLLIVSAIVSEILSVFAVFRSIRTFNALRRRMRVSKLSERQRAKLRGITWESLPFRQKLRIFNMWFVISIVGNAFNIIAGILDVFDVLNADIPDVFARLSIGMGAMLALANLMRYFEFNKSYYMLVMTLRNGAPIMGRFLLSIMPIYLGFAFFGVALFSQYSVKFENFSQACVTLFAVVHGDVILETYDAIYLASPVISRAYMYTFVTLFICAVLNVFVHIVEESYEYARDVVFGHATAVFNDHDLFEEKVFGLMLKKHDRFSRKQRYKARTSKERKAWKQRMAEDSASSSSSSSSAPSETMNQAVQWVHERQMSTPSGGRASSTRSFGGRPATPTTASRPIVRPVSDDDDFDSAAPLLGSRPTPGPEPDAPRGRVRRFLRTLLVGADDDAPDQKWTRLFHSRAEEDQSSFSASVVGDSSDMGSSSHAQMDDVKHELQDHIDKRFDELLGMMRQRRAPQPAEPEMRDD